MLYHSTFFKKFYIRNPEIETKLFLCPFTSSTYGTDAPLIRARIYAHAEGRDDKLLLMPSCFAKLLQANFSCFDKIRWIYSIFFKPISPLPKEYIRYFCK
jgi:hypothetical protein